MVMRSLRDGASGGFMKYILFGILGMSVGGLVVMDVRGVLGGGGVGASDVAKVENHTINIRDFDRTLRRSLSRYRTTPEQAYAIVTASIGRNLARPTNGGKRFCKYNQERSIRQCHYGGCARWVPT